METIMHAVAVALRIGFIGALLVMGGVFLAYGLESHCWNPTGCHNTSPEALQAAWTADHAGGRWGK